MSDDKSDGLASRLAIEEYKSCRDLIAKNIDIIEKNEVYGVGAAGAVAVFSLSATDRTVCLVGSYLPLAISVVGLVRYFGIDRTIHKINNYLEGVEARYEGVLGWTRSYRSANKVRWLKGSRYLIWTILIALSVVLIHVAYLIPFPRPTK